MSDIQIQLRMIVKDESHIILECLQSIFQVIDSYFIADTGSTDNTKALIKNFFEDKNIPGEVVDHEWKNFGWNRSLIMNSSVTVKTPVYILMIDADDLWNGDDKNLLKSEIRAQNFPNALWVNIKRQNIVFKRQQIFKANDGWIYKGVLHEYATNGKERTNILGNVSRNFFIEARTLGNRTQKQSEDLEKYRNDVEILKQGLVEEPDNERYVFYLAQSYRDSKDDTNALQMYIKRFLMGGWNEEVYYSAYQAGLCCLRLGKLPDFELWMMKAVESRPTRVEALYSLVKTFRENAEFYKAYHYLQKAKGIPFPKDDVLFVEPYPYLQGLDYEESIISFYVNKMKEGLEAAMRYLLKGLDLYDNVTGNIKFYIQKSLADIVYHNSRDVEHDTVFCQKDPETNWVKRAIFALDPKHKIYTQNFELLPFFWTPQFFPIKGHFCVSLCPLTIMTENNDLVARYNTPDLFSKFSFAGSNVTETVNHFIVPLDWLGRYHILLFLEKSTYAPVQISLPFFLQEIEGEKITHVKYNFSEESFCFYSNSSSFQAVVPMSKFNFLPIDFSVYPFTKQEEKIKVVVSTSTSPLRLKYMKYRLREILNFQTFKPHRVYLNLPRFFARTGEAYDENMIEDLKTEFGDALIVERLEQDFGNISKLLPAVMKGEKLIFSIDDDIGYDYRLIEEMVERMIKTKADCVAHRSVILKGKDPFNHVEGFAGILYNADSAFEEDFVPFIKSILHHKACFRGDDYVISHYFQKKGKKIETMCFDYPTRIPLHVLEYGLQGDALHVEDGTCVIEDRFAECKAILEKLNLP